MLPETIVCWRWPPRPGYRSTYGPETVNTLRAMVERHYARPHRFVCVTDDTNGIDPRVEIVTPWNDFADVPSPHGGKNPSCYRRLRMFHPEIGEVFGARFVSLDLDVVITGDLAQLWNRPEEIVLFGDTNPQPGSHYNGSMVLMTAGSRPFVWTDFNPSLSPKLSLQARCWGSDQGWISYRLGGGEGKFTKHDGVFSFRNHMKSQPWNLPATAKLVVFHGAYDPWSEYVQKTCPWVRQHYRNDDLRGAA